MNEDERSALIQEHFKDLQTKYPELDLRQNCFGGWIVRGPLRASAVYDNKEFVIEDVVIELTLPSIYPDAFPVVKETTGLTKDFHTNDDGTLCLGSPLAVKATFKKNATLVGFVENSVIPFFFSFFYWKECGELPYGELSHGAKGLLEYYQDIFDVSSGDKVVGLLRILADDDYRGHLPCPCGSNAIVRRCHGDTLREIAGLQTSQQFYLDHLFIAIYLREKGKTIQKEHLSKRLLSKKSSRFTS
jgi:hypothetical protein